VLANIAYEDVPQLSSTSLPPNRHCGPCVVGFDWQWAVTESKQCY